MENSNNISSESQEFYPPKPILAEPKRNNVIRSITSLLFYAILFYFIFDQNVVYIAAVLVVLLIHEFGHFFAMKLYNYQNVKMFIIPLLGAFVSGKKQQVSQKQMSVIILAGPLPGILMAIPLYILNQHSPNETLKLLANTFMFLNLFNLLPIYPLDGGRFLENLFLKNNYGIRIVFTVISVLILIGLIIITQSLIMIIIPALMILELYNETRHQKIREYLDQEKIDYNTDYANLSDKNYWLIRDCILFSFQKKYNSIPAGNHTYSVMEPILIQHVSGLLKANFKQDLSSFSKIALLLFYIFVLIGLPIMSYILFF